MPTKQEIMEYLNERHTHTMYTASTHFNVEISELYKVVKS